jgi:hypothetical protein
MPAFTANLTPHVPGASADGREPIHKEHNITKFEWSIYDVKGLVKHLDDCQPSIWALSAEEEKPESLPEILKRGVVIGEGWYKLEIGEWGVREVL